MHILLEFLLALLAPIAALDWGVRAYTYWVREQQNNLYESASQMVAKKLGAIPLSTPYLLGPSVLPFGLFCCRFPQGIVLLGDIKNLYRVHEQSPTSWIVQINPDEPLQRVANASTALRTIASSLNARLGVPVQALGVVPSDYCFSGQPPPPFITRNQLSIAATELLPALLSSDEKPDAASLDNAWERLTNEAQSYKNRQNQKNMIICAVYSAILSLTAYWIALGLLKP